MDTKKYSVVFQGLRPLMFDRYAGDNNTQLPTGEKMYLDSSRHMIMPALNVMSLLCSENTKSVSRQFFGKNGKTIALGIASYCNIEPFEIPILDGDGKQIIFSDFNEKIYIHRAVARLPKGVPNAKERPTIALPWEITFTIEYTQNIYCTLENLRQALAMGGTLGLGTFRPFFGRYELVTFAEL